MQVLIMHSVLTPYMHFSLSYSVSPSPPVSLPLPHYLYLYFYLNSPFSPPPLLPSSSPLPSPPLSVPLLESLCVCIRMNRQVQEGASAPQRRAQDKHTSIPRLPRQQYVHPLSTPVSGCMSSYSHVCISMSVPWEGRYTARQCCACVNERVRGGGGRGSERARVCV